MRGILLGLALSVGALAGLPALAQEVDCQNAVTQADMNLCAQRAWQAEDDRLNQAYKEAMAELRGWDADLSPQLKGGPEKLREAQRAWITFRDAGCAAEGFPMRGGSAEPLLVYGCMTRVTRERAEALFDLANYGTF